MKIAISGGGICGLTLALAAKTAGMTPIVIEQRPDIQVQSFGGGIGLWPPSQQVFEQLGLLKQLENASGIMPSASYYNHKGQKLGQPSQNFGQKYRILVLERVMLSKILHQECLAKKIDIRTGISVSDAISSPKSVKIQLSNGQQIQARALIGADGINSEVRNIIMKQRKKPEVIPHHCGYAYFRAVIDLSKINGYQHDGDKWHNYAFESWGEEKRFGYVPLKKPLTFWFIAVPINKYGLSEYHGSHTCSQDQKKWIVELFQHWRAPVSIRQLIEHTPAETILRTDIRKIKGVTEFPWNSKNNNILIIGDAANATAPNLAQGAGLAIESAWDLVSMVNFNDGSGIDKFMQKRRKRAQTVQYLADMVADIGQLKPPMSSFRDFSMSTVTKYLPSVEQKTFQAVVNHSLGGSSDALHWLAAHNAHEAFRKNQIRTNCLLARVLGEKDFNKLPEKTQIFRSEIIGEGKGDVSVKAGFGSKFFGLSDSMKEKNFGAYVDTYYNLKTNSIEQKWTRVFGEGEKGAKKYQTVFRATPYSGSTGTGLTMTESLGKGFIRDLIRFGYDVKVLDERIHYKSIGLWLYNYKLPIPRFLLPTSQWSEEQTKQGWFYDGVIRYPKILGGLNFFNFKGHFAPKQHIPYKQKAVVIAGGSGFIGKSVARTFHKNGWHVTILSRSSNKIYQLPFAQIEKWDPQTSFATFEEQVNNLTELLRGKDVVINLAGESPAGARWTDSKKQKILNSRLNSIKVLSDAINKLNDKNMVYIQSSAAGIYGSRKDEVLSQDAPESQKDTFRIKCVKELESLTKANAPQAVLLRIGHVLGSQGGMLPFLKVFSFMRGKKYGAGGQYIPWVHVQDVGSAVLHIANKGETYKGQIVNMSSPEHHTYDSLYKTMGKIHSRTPFFTIPQWVFKLLLGELSSVLLESQRIHPQKLLDNGFQFQFDKLDKALASRALL